MAGNLAECLSNNYPLQVRHRLESVKLIKGRSTDKTDPQFHGLCTKKAVGYPEQKHRNRPRVFSLAVTARDGGDRGKPSAWSSALDTLASNASRKRLLVVAAGNVKEMEAWANYPQSNDSDDLRDPAQAWNALTVGACTNLVHITETDAEEYSPIAAAGGLSPFSATSMTWPRNTWPLKPDVVFEGGNVARDKLSPSTVPSLMLLTTNHRPAEKSFTSANATSAATALAARFAAELMAEYPQLWPETVRALIVHSAEWSEAMQTSCLSQEQPSGKDYQALIRRCGFGIPNLDQALYSASNSLTMVIENTLQPFIKEPGKSPATNEMHLHGLPWPADALAQLGEKTVEMRVTLSYFIEPNPSQRGQKSRYQYQSHGLRFAVKRPTEKTDAFLKRINAAALAEDEKAPKSPPDPQWLIGIQGRHKGSLHADIWKGSAADLASREHIGIYPASGWWKTRIQHKGYKKQARYSLVISIKAPEIDVDLYSEVASKIATSVPIET